MKIIKPILQGISTGDMMYLAHQRNKARLNNQRIYCGEYKMFPLFVTKDGFELELPDDEPENFYQN